MGLPKQRKRTKKKKSIVDLINDGMSPDAAIVIGEMPPVGKDISKVLRALKTNELKTLNKNLKAKLKTVMG